MREACLHTPSSIRIFAFRANDVYIVQEERSRAAAASLACAAQRSCCLIATEARTSFERARLFECGLQWGREEAFLPSAFRFQCLSHAMRGLGVSLRGVFAKIIEEISEKQTVLALRAYLAVQRVS